MSQERTKRNVEAALIRQAWIDESFREALLKDSTAVYSEHLAEIDPEAKLPEDLEVRVVEEADEKLYLVLPNASPGAPEKPLDNRSTREDFEAAIVWQAYQDDAFKHELLRDPKSVFESRLTAIKEGVSLPPDLEVEAVEETDDVFYLRIPQPPAEIMELSEEELEAVAGGREEAVSVGVAVGTATQVTSVVVVGLVAVSHAI